MCDTCAGSPPSTAISAPVVNADSSDSRCTTSGAMSSGTPTRPSGVSRTAASWNRAYAADMSGVSTKPGKTAFTRMPAGPYSSAAARERSSPDA